jgi:hypothetical protein
VWLVPFLFAAVKLSINMSIADGRKKGKAVPDDWVFQEIVRHVFSPALLFGKKMVVVADRVGSEEASVASEGHGGTR